MNEINRRSLLAATGAALLCRPAAASTRTTTLFGVQLWTVNAELEQDFEGTLRRVSEIGFRRVETAGLHGRSAREFRRALVRAGLACDSAHVSMPDLEKDAAGRIADARALGARYLVCSSPAPARPVEGGDWLAGMRQAMDLQAWRRNAGLMNRFAAQAARAGLRFAYHNHPFEFARYDGYVGFDELMRLTDPRLVKLELDVGWAVAGGRDPVDLIRRHADRVRLLHLKDLRTAAHPGEGGDLQTVPLGQGVIDWPRVLRAAEAAGRLEAFVEQEPPFADSPLTALDTSYRYLQNLHV